MPTWQRERLLEGEKEGCVVFAGEGEDAVWRGSASASWIYACVIWRRAAMCGRCRVWVAKGEG